MMTNTYLPHVGGVARSVASFSELFRRQGHRVMVVAPTFKNMPAREADVVRVPAIQRFNASDFSFRLPIPGLLQAALEGFEPDVIHAHHPFLLGDTALRLAAARNIPMVFTHHTMYEQYTHYVPGDSPLIKRFAMRLATEFANLCDHVIAPSESIARTIAQRGVCRPITAIPTGIDPEVFRHGDRRAFREHFDLPQSAYVVGHVGRLAPEKNLAFLARAVAQFLATSPDAHFLVVGSGPSEPNVRKACEQRGVGDRLHMTGCLSGQTLVDAYHAMDLFAFASQSETQGMVLAEAMTAGVPVVAVDAPGVREVVNDRVNGRLLPDLNERTFAEALREISQLSEAHRHQMREAALSTAEQFSLERCGEKLLRVYRELAHATHLDNPRDQTGWAQTQRWLENEWHLWTQRTEAAVVTLKEGFRTTTSSSGKA